MAAMRLQPLFFPAILLFITIPLIRLILKQKINKGPNMYRFTSRIALAACCLFVSVPAAARDLVLQNTKVINVSPCDRQIRFSVYLDKNGRGSSGPYRIEVFSLSRKKHLMSLPVDDQDQGQTLYFVVPSGKLVCDSKIRISIDADNEVRETNENNNTAVETLERPKSSGLIESCPVDPQLCS